MKNFRFFHFYSRLVQLQDIARHMAHMIAKTIIKLDFFNIFQNRYIIFQKFSFFRSNVYLGVAHWVQPVYYILSPKIDGFSINKNSRNFQNFLVSFAKNSKMSPKLIIVNFCTKNFEKMSKLARQRLTRQICFDFEALLNCVNLWRKTVHEPIYKTYGGATKSGKDCEGGTLLWSES